MQIPPTRRAIIFASSERSAAGRPRPDAEAAMMSASTTTLRIWTGMVSRIPPKRGRDSPMRRAVSRRPSQAPTTSAALRGRRAEPRQKGAKGRRRECRRFAAGKLCFLQPWLQTAWQQELRCECLEKGDEMEQRAKVVCPSGKGWRPVVIADSAPASSGASEQYRGAPGPGPTRDRG